MAQDIGHHPLPALPPQQQSFSQSQQPQQQQQNPHYSQQYQQQQHNQPQYQQQQYQQQPQQFQQRPPQQPLQQHAHFSQQQPHPQGAYSGQKPPPKGRSFSFRSDKSHGSNNKQDLHETSAEKEAKRLHSKADPTLAMNEAEPSLVQATVKSSLAPLRSIQHRDPLGNPIAEPDRSNPTRSRWERPLDTIRSFEAAIDGGYSSRKSMIRADTDTAANWNRRSSYYGNNGPRFPHDSYYGGRPTSFREDGGGQFEVRQPNRQSYFDSNGNGPAPATSYGAPGPSRQRASRMLSQPELNSYSRGEQSVYPLPHKDRSFETVTSAAASGSSDQHGYQTDPSSENSSIDRKSPGKQPMNDYGIGFNQSPTYRPQAFNVGPNPGLQGGPVGGQANGYPNRKPVSQNHGGPPPPPQKDAGFTRRPVVPQQQQQQRPDIGEKRKSWFARRFSKAS